MHQAKTQGFGINPSCTTEDILTNAYDVTNFTISVTRQSEIEKRDLKPPPDASSAVICSADIQMLFYDGLGTSDALKTRLAAEHPLQMTSDRDNGNCGRIPLSS